MKITVNLSDANFNTAHKAVSYLNQNTVSSISHKPIDMAQNMAITNETGSFPGGSYEASVVKGHYEYSVNIEDEAIQDLATGALKVLLMLWPLYTQYLSIKQLATSIMTGFTEKVAAAFAEYTRKYTKPAKYYITAVTDMWMGRKAVVVVKSNSIHKPEVVYALTAVQSPKSTLDDWDSALAASSNPTPGVAYDTLEEAVKQANTLAREIYSKDKDPMEVLFSAAEDDAQPEGLGEERTQGCSATDEKYYLPVRVSSSGTIIGAAVILLSSDMSVDRILTTKFPREPKDRFNATFCALVTSAEHMMERMGGNIKSYVCNHEGYAHAMFAKLCQDIEMGHDLSDTNADVLTVVIPD